MSGTHEFTEFERDRFSRTADKGGEVVVRQANVEQRSAGDRLTVFLGKPPEEAHQAFGYGKVGQVFCDCHRFVTLFADIFCDVDRELRKTRHEPVDVLGARGAQESFRHADRNRPALDLREDHFFTEDAPRAENCDRDVFVIGGVACDPDRATLDEIDEPPLIALMKEHFALAAIGLDEQLLAIRNRFVGRAFKETRMLQVPNFIFGNLEFARIGVTR